MSALTTQLSLDHPIIVAPMGGGPTTPELVAAVSAAGGLGSLAAAYLTPEQIAQAVTKIRQLTDRPFLINLFTPMPDVTVSKTALLAVISATQKYRNELNLPEPMLKPPFHPDFQQQFEQVLKAKPRAFSFIFGLLDQMYIQECKKNGILSIGTATTLAEAQSLEEIGVDAVIAQGLEAGAHRGIFSTSAADPNISVLELTKLCCSKLRVPVIATGGIMTGTEIAATLKVGAQAAMLGTAFLLCPESGTSKPYRSALLNSAAENLGTRLTRAFSGRLARGIENRFLKEMEKYSSSILPFPAQNAFTRDIRNQSTQLGKSEYLSLWAGQGYKRIREMSAKELMRLLINELK